MGIRSRPLEKTSQICKKRQNFVKMAFWGRFFLQGAQIACKSRNTTSHVFGLFTPLFRRFTLSGVVFEIELDETHRLVSSILHFMPSGSIQRFSIDFRQMFDRCSIDFLQIFDRFSIDFRQIFDRFSIDFRQMFDRFSIDVRQMFDRFSIDFRQIFDRCSIDFLQIFDRCSIDFQQIFDRFSIDVRQIFDRFSIDFRSIFYRFSNIQPDAMK